jgi:hypothetical protein
MRKAGDGVHLAKLGGGLENRPSATLNKVEVCRYNGLKNRRPVGVFKESLQSNASILNHKGIARAKGR